MNITADDFLAHYGVKGMKWGVRKKRETQKIANDAKRADYSLAKIGAPSSTQYKPLSNAAIRDLNKRLQLEADLRRLTPVPEPEFKRKIDIGRNHVIWALGIGATMNQVYRFSKTPVGQALMEQAGLAPSGRHFKK